MTPIAIVTTIGAYGAVLLGLAWFSGRRADNAGFFTGNRATPWYAAAFAMVAAAMSGVTFISVPGSVAADGFSYLQMVMGFTIGQLAVAFVLVPLFYRLQVVSLYEFLQRRFGPVTHRSGAAVFILSKCVSAALRLYVACTVLQQFLFGALGLPFGVNVLLVLLFVVMSTRRGGVKSLIWTDMLKSLLLVAGVAGCVWGILRSEAFGAGEAAELLRTSPMTRIFRFDDPASPRYFWKMFIAGIFLLITMTGLDQEMMQQNLSCRDARSARKNIILTALCQFVVITLMLVLGVLLYGYAERQGIALPARSDLLFPQVAVAGGLPVGVGVLFVLGLVATTCSSAGAALTALTTSVTVDLLDAPARCSDAALTRIRKRVHATLALAMGAILFGVDRFGSDSLINTVFTVAGYTYGPLLGMFAFGLLTRRPVRDRWMPAVVVAAPLLSAALQAFVRSRWGWQIGFELLICNGLFTMLGMAILMRYDDKKTLVSPAACGVDAADGR